MAASELVPIFCRTCGRRVALSTGKAMHTIYCDELCADGIPFTQTEERDDLIEVLARQERWTAARIATHFGLSRQAVEHVLRRRAVA